MNCATVSEFTPEWLNNLKLCLCGERVTKSGSTPHRGCIISGIERKIFTDSFQWEEYCRENGQRIARFYQGSLENSSTMTVASG